MPKEISAGLEAELSIWKRLVKVRSEVMLG
jgi:hypothetical protein